MSDHILLKADSAGGCGLGASGGQPAALDLAETLAVAHPLDDTLPHAGDIISRKHPCR